MTEPTPNPWFPLPRTTPFDRKLDIIMATLNDLQAAASQITTDVQEAVSALDDLSSKVGSGESISQADIDAVTETLRSASASLDAAVAKDDPAPQAAPVVMDPAPTTDAPVDAPQESPASDTQAPDPAADNGTTTTDPGVTTTQSV